MEFIDDGSAIVTLFRKANGFPRPVMGWLENNTPVISGTVSQNESISSLVIAFNETTEKSIKYRCIARNSEGSTLSEEATLTVARRGTRGRFQRVVRQFLIFTTNNTGTVTHVYYGQTEIQRLSYLTTRRFETRVRRLAALFLSSSAEKNQEK